MINVGGKRYAWKLLVERVTADQQPRVMGNQPATGATSVPLRVVEGARAPSYAVDVRTAAGSVSHLSGVTLDGNNRFLLDQAHLSPGATNWVRVKAEGSEGAVYSRAVRVVLNPAAVPGGENQIRAVSLSRSGTDLILRWGLAAENGKPTRIYFKRSDNGAVTLLTQAPLNAGVRSFTLAAQGLSSPCGDFHLGQVGSDDVESPLTPALFFAGIDLGIGHEGGCIGNPPSTPEPPKWADYYHVRDHLGTLRLVTDISGYPQEAHDYEPFGVELVPPGESIGTLTTRKFTGHERDASTGLDYMMARYFSANLARFLPVDPLADSARAGTPQTWNRYAYAFNKPIRFNDPSGEDGNDVANWVDRQVNAFKGFVDANTGGGAMGVALNAAVSTAGDLVSGAADALRVGAATGEAYGAGAGAGDLAFAAGGDALRGAALGTGIYGAVRVATRTTIVHFTDDAGRAAISESGHLRAGSYVTKPGEIPKGATAGQVETKLEISAGKGSYSISARTSRTNLKTPADGPTTSGGAAQKQLKSDTKIDPKKFQETPQ